MLLNYIRLLQLTSLVPNSVHCHKEDSMKVGRENSRGLPHLIRFEVPISMRQEGSIGIVLYLKTLLYPFGNLT